MNVFFATTFSAFAQDYKHPHLDASGQVVDSVGTKLGWITKEGVIYNAKGEKIGAIEQQELVNYKGHRLGVIGKDVTFKDNDGKVVFYIDATSKANSAKYSIHKEKLLPPSMKITRLKHVQFIVCA